MIVAAAREVSKRRNVQDQGEKCSGAVYNAVHWSWCSVSCADAVRVVGEIDIALRPWERIRYGCTQRGTARRGLKAGNASQRANGISQSAGTCSARSNFTGRDLSGKTQ